MTVRAQAADLFQGIAKHAFGDAQHGHHGPHAQENAEYAQHRAHFPGSQQIGPQRSQPRAKRLEQSGRDPHDGLTLAGCFIGQGNAPLID